MKFFFFLENQENKTGKLVQDLFLLFSKAFYELKANGLQLQYISIVVNMRYNKNKLYKTLGYGSRDMFNFDFFRKGSGDSFSSTFWV